MKNILRRSHRKRLEAFLRRKVLLAFDYDGTLAPIVRERYRATMRASTRRLLGEVARRYPCAVLSGRARREILERVKGLGLAAVAGNHGMEYAESPARVSRARKLVGRWAKQLEASLATCQGVEIENKKLSLSVHYRKAKTRRRARLAILAAIAELGTCRVMGGKRVINVLPADSVHKGTALLHMQRRLRCPHAMYVGDDVTDEDVFALRREKRLLTIRVVRSRRSRARYYLAAQPAIDKLLEACLQARPESTK